MTTTTTTEQLRAELAAREAAEQAAQEAQAARVKAAQDDYDLHVIDVHHNLDRQLEAEGNTHLNAAREALHSLDLNGAFNGYCRWKATRLTRDSIRTAAQSAEANLNTGRQILPELRYIAETFTEWITRETSGANRPEDAIAAGEAERLLGTRPATVEDLEANRGN